MSLPSSLEVDITSIAAPRAAVFQPKVKPRARKGAVAAPRKSAAPTAIPSVDVVEEAVATTSIDPPLSSAAEGTADVRVPIPSVNVNEPVATASIEASEFQNPPSSAAEGIADDVRGGTGESDAGVREDEGIEAFGFQNPPSLAAEGIEDGRDGTGESNAAATASIEATESQIPSASEAEGTADGRGRTGEDIAGVTGEVATAFTESLEVQDPPSSAAEGIADVRGETREYIATDLEQEPVPEVGQEGQKAVPVIDPEQEPAADDAEPATKTRRKRAFSHSTSSSRRNRPDKDLSGPPVDLSKTDLSNPAKLTMREIIRRAEAIERKKVKAAEGAKKSAQTEAAATKQQEQPVESAARDAVSMAPQVQVINGRIVINEQSLTIGAYDTSRLNTDSYKRVEENASRLNYHSYANRVPTERWKSDDTDVFYRALQQFGTDFELIQNLFPGRNRRQVKAKFKKEERNNPKRLQDALAHRPTDQGHYKDMIDRLKAEEASKSAEDPFDAILAFSKDNATADEPMEVT